MTDIPRLIAEAEDAGMAVVPRRDGHVLIFGNRTNLNLIDKLAANVRAVAKEVTRPVRPRHEIEVLLANAEARVIAVLKKGI